MRSRPFDGSEFLIILHRILGALHCRIILTQFIGLEAGIPGNQGGGLSLAFPFLPRAFIARWEEEVLLLLLLG